jgi:DNA-binding CsgD family transcriptional regulator
MNKATGIVIEVDAGMQMQLSQGAICHDSFGQNRMTRAQQPAISRLTDRQKDCLRLVANGFTSKEIGRQLDLSPSTVDNHILLATQALGVGSRAEAARFLASSEARQKLPSQSSALADDAISGVLSFSTEAKDRSIPHRSTWMLPPIGGQRNDLDAAEKTVRIIQVAAIGFATVMGLVLLIAGAFKLFS